VPARLAHRPPARTPPRRAASLAPCQQQGELPAGVDPAALRLVLPAAVAAPVVFPGHAGKLFGTTGDPEFENRYARALQRLPAYLPGRSPA